MKISEDDFYKDSSSQGMWFYKLGLDFTKETMQELIETINNPPEKLLSKLKMMEISFEQINNSRNDLIKQLAEQEKLNEEWQPIVHGVKKRLEDLERMFNNGNMDLGFELEIMREINDGEY